ncbi:AbrB/MazE/SpoVT family DNA-binding domain-containing protein [Candidatus Bathyarchaeota archaeon]|nr:AbrB/MazE/SpoVT family DNA-binding domain-containing protein [Candidatus Bathyarchaeota archaeon]
MVERTVVQRRFTVTIPKEIRERLGIREGMELLWDVEGDRIILKPISLMDLVGRFEGAVDYTEEVKEEVERLFLHRRDG